MEYLNSKKQLLLEALREHFPASSRRTFEGWVKAKRVYIGDAIAQHLNQMVEEGESIRFHQKPSKKFDKLSILFQDRDLIVINKPAGLLSVKSDEGHQKSAHDMIKQGMGGKVFVIHRLDRETSGVMLFAFTEKAFRSLKQQFAARTAGRTYAAIVEGTGLPESGRWRSYLLDDELIVQTTPNQQVGKHAVADFRVLTTNRDLSFLKVKLQTGRKNQIRVQAAEAGHPVVGDKKYGSAFSPIRRLGLHAARLSFEHPTTKKQMVFLAPIPELFLKPFKGERHSLQESFNSSE